jgi:phosphatidylinositol alpha-1,6-mannosyltransferase
VPKPSILLSLTGLHIDGGIAAVSRCVARALEEEVRGGRLARADRVLLLDDPAHPAAPPACGEQHLARGSQARFVWQTWRSFRRHRHDLVFFDLVGLARSMLLPLPGLPPRFAVFAHGIELEAARHGPRARALLAAHCVLANSHFTADRLRAQLPDLGDRIRVVPLCIDPARVEAWQALERGQGAPPREPAALIVGRMWAAERGKGHDELLAAWPSVRRQVPGAELWIAGGGDDLARLEAKARELGLADAVRFFGRVSDDELGSLYRRASVFAMPSRQEGFGLAWAEAMWWGLPCIGATADAAGQVIREGETGELVPYGDVAALGGALVRLLWDAARARCLGEAGRRRAREHFAYGRFRSDLLAALELEPGAGPLA